MKQPTSSRQDDRKALRKLYADSPFGQSPMKIAEMIPSS
jgi:hypothetical protein